MMYYSGQYQPDPVLYGRHVMGSADHVSAVGRGKRQLSHYSSEHMILLVGEGDFSFASSLANGFGIAYNIVATSLDSTDDLRQKYGANAFDNLSNLQSRGAQVYHGVDACSMASQNIKYEFGGRLHFFDRVIYNFPHAGFLGKENDDYMIGKHKELVLNFFRNAVQMLLHGGEVHVTHKYGNPYDKWRLVKQAQKCGLVLKSRPIFNPCDFPGYCNRRGAGSKAGKVFQPCNSATFIFKEKLVQEVGMECETSFTVTIFDHAKNCVSTFTDPYAAVEVMKESIVRKGLASSGTCPVQVVTEEIARLTTYRKHGGLGKKKQTLFNVMELILKELATRSQRISHQLGKEHGESNLKVEETFKNKEHLTGKEQLKEDLVQEVGMECETSFTVTIFDHAKNCVSTFTDPYAAVEVMKESIVRKGLASSGTCPVQVVTEEIARLTTYRKHGGLGKKKQTLFNVMELILKELATRSQRISHQLGKEHGESNLKVEETFKNKEHLTGKEQLKEDLVQEVGMECETSFTVTIFDHAKNCVSTFTDPYAAVEVMKESIVRKGLASSGTCPVQVVTEEIARLTTYRKHGGLGKKKQTLFNVMELILKELATRSQRISHQLGKEHGESNLKVEETFKNKEHLTGKEQLKEDLVQEVGMECETSFTVTIFDHAKNCVSTFTDPYAAVEVMKESIVRKGLASSGTCPVQVVTEEIARLTTYRKHGGLGKKKQTLLNVMELILKELATRSQRISHQLGKEHGESNLKVEETFKNKEHLTGKEQLKEDLVQEVGMECETSFSVTVFDHSKNCVSTFTDPYAAVEVMKESIVRKGLASSGTCPVQVVKEEIARLTSTYRKHGGLGKKKQTLLNVMELILKELATRSQRISHQLGNKHAESSLKEVDTVEDDQSCTLLCKRKIEELKEKSVQKLCVPKEASLPPAPRGTKGVANAYVEGTTCGYLEEREFSKREQSKEKLMQELSVPVKASQLLDPRLTKGVPKSFAEGTSCGNFKKTEELTQREQLKEKLVQMGLVSTEASQPPDPRHTKGVAESYAEGTSCDNRKQLSKREQLKERLIKEVGMKCETVSEVNILTRAKKFSLRILMCCCGQQPKLRKAWQE